MEFFESLAAIGTGTQWTFVIVVADDGRMNTLVEQRPIDFINKSGVKLPARRFVGTAQDFDNNLISELKTFAPQLTEFFQNMREFETSIQSKNKEAQSKAKTPAAVPVLKQPPKDPRQDKFNALMEKIAALEKDGKFRQAIAILLKVTDMPSFATPIAAKIKELKRRDGGFTLFTEEPETAATATAAHTPEETPVLAEDDPTASCENPGTDNDNLAPAA